MARRFIGSGLGTGGVFEATIDTYIIFISMECYYKAL